MSQPEDKNILSKLSERNRIFKFSNQQIFTNNIQSQPDPT